MNNRIMVKMTSTPEAIHIITRSRRTKSPHTFIILRSRLAELEKKHCLIVNDIHSFAELRIHHLATGQAALRIDFTWLSYLGGGKLSGWKETVLLPHEEFRQFLMRSAGKEEDTWRVLSVEEKCVARLEFHSNHNLHAAVENKHIRHKLGKVLEQGFCWPSSRRIVISDDFLPYSFFFREDSVGGKGICGGIILHQQGDHAHAKYQIHT